MANENSTKGEGEELERYDFLIHADAKKLFAKLDLELRNGSHVNFYKHERLWKFLNRNYESLKFFYGDFYEVILDMGGNDQERYYFLDFKESETSTITERGNLQSYDYLRGGSILIGLFICYVYFADRKFSLNSSATLISLLQTDYEEYKKDFYRLLASLNKEESTDFNDRKLVTWINKALKEFEQLGWIMYNDNSETEFRILPAMDRLRIIYAQQIDNIGELLAKIENNG